MDKVSDEFTFGRVIFGNSPLLIYVVSYLSGILIGSKYALYPVNLFIFSAIFSALTFLIYYFCFKVKSLRLEFPVILFTIFSFIILGWFNICSSDYGYNRIEKSNLLKKKEIWADCIITERPVKKEKITSVQVIIPKYSEGMILYLDKQYQSSNLEVGDTIFVKLKPERVTNNAGSRFNYAGYLEKRGIYSTSFVRLNEIELHKLVSLSINQRISKIREKYISKIIQLTGSESEASTLIAITIGEKSYLDKDIKDAYSNSGTMHLLAVSGLHVGFIYAFLAFSLLILGNYRFSKIAKTITITSSLWFFAAIAGFAPSITRAVIMATVYEICNIIERRKIGLNTLSLSALIITIFEPQAIFDIGFQLSYVALLSIILIHPIINQYYFFKNRILKYIWATLSISLACQIGTSIITITTFGFFPTYFLIANLLAIPLSALILYFALGQLIFMGNSAITLIIADILRLLVKILNSSVIRIESLPFPTITLSLNNGQIISLLMMIVLYTFEIFEDKLYKRYILLGLIVNFIVCSL